MLYRFKPLLILGCCLVFSLWWFGAHKKDQSNDPFYTKEAYAEDVSKVYYDIGHFAEVRKDLQAAIKAYTTALEKKPDFWDAYKRLTICCNRMHNKKGTYRVTLQATDSVCAHSYTNINVMRNENIKIPVSTKLQ